MDSEGHIKLKDFDLTKILTDSNNKAFTLYLNDECPEAVKVYEGILNNGH